MASDDYRPERDGVDAFQWAHDDLLQAVEAAGYWAGVDVAAAAGAEADHEAERAATRAGLNVAEAFADGVARGVSAVSSEWSPGAVEDHRRTRQKVAEVARESSAAGELLRLTLTYLTASRPLWLRWQHLPDMSTREIVADAYTLLARRLGHLAPAAPHDGEETPS